ncbi:hypothetical protein [Corynebacterium sp. H130]|uniref:hypothetical protein n=1 Tax=Corynebacterium sp. H130 TaxID=3133444 RepID=UPI00309656F7
MKTLLRRGFGIVFAAGTAIHLYVGSRQPEAYSAFANSAWPPLDVAWSSFVMPHIRELTLLMAAIEGGIAIGLLWQRKYEKLAVWTAIAFFTFLIPLGYAWETNSWGEDLLKNRLGSVIMILAIAPLLREKSAKDRR